MTFDFQSEKTTTTNTSKPLPVKPLGGYLFLPKRWARGTFLKCFDDGFRLASHRIVI
jgi:hypothetical protein